MMKSRLFILALITVLASASTYAQQGGTITADPNAQPLRPIWQVQGNIVGGDRVGEGIAGLGDIYGTGKGAWGVYAGRLQQSWIFRNDSNDISKDMTPVRVFDDLFVELAGDFWGTGHKALALAGTNTDTTDPNRPKYYFELHLFRTEGDTIADSAALILNTRLMTPPRQASPDVILAADLDHDGADELILVHAGVGSDTGISHNPEIWIYKGGPNFQVDSPTVIIKESIPNDLAHIYAATGDFDGDGHSDIVLSQSRGNGQDHLSFYWGTGDVMTFGQPVNTRIIMLGAATPTADLGFTALDCDGDRTMDLAIDRTLAQPVGTYLFRSGIGKNARTRTYHLDDADIVFPNAPFNLPGGYINDSTHKYAMLCIGKVEGDPSTRPAKAFFAGGTDGPDLAYDAYIDAPLGHVPIPDVDGDGWDDYMGSNYTVNSNGGIAAIYAGGSYIPGPRTSGVEAIAGEGHQQAVTVWPNPVRDELHIAWRGDLKRMPSRFVVHDVLGREVTDGDVKAVTGAALWHCADVASGIYLLSMYDRHGILITTTTIIKE